MFFDMNIILVLFIIKLALTCSYCSILTNTDQYKPQIIQALLQEPDSLLSFLVKDSGTDSALNKTQHLHSVVYNEIRKTNTRASIQRMLTKALKGENVVIVVIGESVSVGADLGSNNTRLVFQQLVAKWWNDTIGEITGSYMIVKTVAVGGVSSTYFGRCWKEYMMRVEPFDFLMWEFNINDYSQADFDIITSIERFIRDFFATYMRTPSLFVLFQQKRKRNSTTNGTRVLVEGNSENLTNLLANHYNISSVASVIDVKQYERFFSKRHPSSEAHQQMAAFIVELIRSILLDLLSYRTLATGNSQASSLASPLYVGYDVGDTVCWNAVYPDFKDLSWNDHLLFDLPYNKSDDIVLIEGGWSDIDEKRYDTIGGFAFKKPNQKLTLNFPVLLDNGLQRKRTLSLAVKRKVSSTNIFLKLTNNGRVVMSKNETFDSSRSLDKLYVVNFDSEIMHGECSLQMTFLEGIEFILSAVIVS